MAKNKAMPMQSAAYKLLHKGFTEWLQLLNYSSLSIPCLTRAIQDFFQYQVQINKTELQQLQATDANAFLEQLQNRKSYSNGHINKQIQALKLFSRYIRETGRSNTGFNLERLSDVRG